MYKRQAITDKAVAERMTQKIDMEWVIVRPVVLADKPAKGRYTAGPLARVAPLVPLSFDDCSYCLLRAATDEPGESLSLQCAITYDAVFDSGDAVTYEGSARRDGEGSPPRISCCTTRKGHSELAMSCRSAQRNPGHRSSLS